VKEILCFKEALILVWLDRPIMCMVHSPNRLLGWKKWVIPCKTIATTNIMHVREEHLRMERKHHSRKSSGIYVTALSVLRIPYFLVVNSIRAPDFKTLVVFAGFRK
jgi:hypothetical protein